MSRSSFVPWLAALALAAGCGDDSITPTEGKGVRIISFAATPNKIRTGQVTVLSWEIVGATGVNIEPGVGLQAAEGMVEVRPVSTTTYTLFVKNGDQELTSQVTVEVTGGAPRIEAFTATPRTIQQGETSTLEWVTANANDVEINPDLGVQPANGTLEVMPDRTTTYQIVARGDEGTATLEVQVVVASGNQPAIESFTATPQTLAPGTDVELAWSTRNAVSVTIDNGVGQRMPTGTVTVRPTRTTIYNLTAVGDGGQAKASVTVTVTGEPSVLVFAANPTTIAPGGSTLLNWETDNAVGVTIDNGVGQHPAKGDVSVTPAQTTTYTLTAHGSGAEDATAMVTVTVSGAGEPVITSFTAAPQAIVTGGSTTLTWTTQNATGVSIDNGVGMGGPNDSIQVSPTQTTTYRLTATGSNGQATSDLVVTVSPGTPTVTSFSANPTSITSGQMTTLSWQTTGATSVDIDNGIGMQAASGSIQVNPTQSTLYTLFATGPGGQTSAQADVTVTAVGAPIIVSFDAQPLSIQPGGMSALSWQTQDADTVTIDNGVGMQAVNGTTNVSPPTTTTYTLTASGPGGQTTSQRTITVQSQNGDECSNPFLITGSGTFNGNTQTALHHYSPGAGGCTGYAATGPDVVYRVPLQSGDRLRASLNPTGGTWDTSLYLLTSCSNAAQSCVTGQDNGNPEEIDYTAPTAGDYFLIVDGFGGAGGQYQLVVDLNPAPIPNDQCAGAINVTAGGVYFGSTRNANGDYDSGAGGCTGFASTSRDVTYSVDLQPGERVQASLNATWDSALYAVTDCAMAASTCVAGEDNGNPEQIDYTSPAGGRLFLIVDGYRAASGDFELTVAVSPPVVGGETCTNPVAIPAGGGSFQSTTVGAVDDYQAACTGAAQTGPDLAYSIDLAPGDVVEALVDFPGHDGSLYVATDCAMLQSCVASADDSGAGQSEIVRFVAQQSSSHFLIVDSAGPAGGHDLTVAHYGGDICADAAPLLTTGAQEWFTTTAAANDYSPGSGGCTGFSASGEDRVYSVALQAGDQLQLTASPSSGWDVSTYLVSNCADVTGSCVAGADRADIGEAENLYALVQQSGTYYAIIDGFFGDDGDGLLDANIARGDTCQDAYLVPPGGGVFSGTTIGYAADYGTSVRTGSCTNWQQDGADAVYRIDLANGQALSASLTTAWDGSLYLITDCAQSASSCVAGQDNGSPEELSYTNSSGSAQTYYLVVDSWLAGMTYEGAYTLTITIQ